MAHFARRSHPRRGSRRYRHPHRFEALESRCLLACQVFVQDGTLFVVGDDAANDIAIVGSERGVVVSCDGSVSEPFAGVSAIRAELRDGDDGTMIDNSNGVFNGIAIEVFGEGGNDSFSFKIAEASEGKSDPPVPPPGFAFDGGSGVDQLQIIAGLADHHIDVKPNVQSIRVEDLTIDVRETTTGVDWDFRTAQVEQVTIRAGGGNDTAEIHGPLPGIAIKVFGQVGNDEFIVSFPSGEFTVGGEANVAELVVDGGEGLDTASVIRGIVLDPGFPRLGPSEDVIDVRPGAEPGSIEIKMTERNTRLAKIDGRGLEGVTIEAGGGDDHVRVHDPDALLDGIDWNIITGDGDDMIDVSAAVGAAATWNLNAGPGKNTARFKIADNESPRPQDRTIFNFNYFGGDGKDHVDLDTRFTALLFEQNVNIVTAGGDDVVNMKGGFTAEDARQKVRIDTGDGNDTVSYDWLVHVDRQLISPIEILAGAGNDTSRFRISGTESPRPQDRTFLNFNYFAGTGRDTVEIELVALTLTGQSRVGVDFAPDNVGDTLDLSLRSIVIAREARLHVDANLAGPDNEFNSVVDHVTVGGTLDWDVQIGPGTTRYKPLFAFLIVDLDGKFNFNQHFAKGSGQAEFVMHDSIIAGDWNWNYHGGAARHRMFAIIDRTQMRSNVFAVWTTVGFFEVNFQTNDVSIPGVMDVKVQSGSPGSKLNLDAQRVEVPGEFRWQSDGFAETTLRAVNWLVGGIADLHFGGTDGSDRYRLDLDVTVPSGGELGIEVDGRGGNDNVAASLLFEAMGNGLIDVALFGGDGDDLLSLLASGRSDRPPRLLINGGRGFDKAFATENVDVVNCEVVRRQRRA